MVNREAAILIAEKQHGPGFKFYGIYHGIPDNCTIYGSRKWVPDDVWCVLCASVRSLERHGHILTSSRAILISKETGEILYDDSANDEG